MSVNFNSFPHRNLLPWVHLTHQKLLPIAPQPLFFMVFSQLLFRYLPRSAGFLSTCPQPRLELLLSNTRSFHLLPRTPKFQTNLSSSDTVPKLFRAYLYSLVLLTKQSSPIPAGPITLPQILVPDQDPLPFLSASNLSFLYPLQSPYSSTSPTSIV